MNIRYLKRLITVIGKTELLVTTLSLILIALLSYLIPIFQGTYDYTYFSVALMTLIKIICRMIFLMIVILKNIPNANAGTIFKYFIFSCVLYIAGTVVMILVSPIKNVFLDIVKMDDSQISLAKEGRYATRFGWAGFSGFEYTFKCVLALIFNNYFIEKAMSNKDKKVWAYLVVSLILAVGTLFYGRVGTLFAIFIFLYLLLKLLIKKPKLLLVFVAVIVIAAVALVILQTKNKQLQEWFEWAFSLFLTYFETGKLETESSNVLFEQMLFIPDAKTIAWGDARYMDGSSYYMRTDAGIMRPLLFGGVWFAALRYLSLYFPLITNAIDKKKYKHQSAVFIWTLLLCIVFEIKGEIVFSCLPIILLVLSIDKITQEEKALWKEI